MGMILQPDKWFVRLKDKVLYLYYLLRTSISEWLNDECPRKGAAISYYAVFSMAPLLLLLVSMVGFFFGEEQVRQQLLEQVNSVAGSSAAGLLSQFMQSSNGKSGVVAAISAFAFLLVGASGVLVELRQTLDDMWLSKPPTHNNSSVLTMTLSFVRDRVAVFSIVLAIGFLMIVSLAVSAYLAMITQWMNSYASGLVELGRWAASLVSFAVLTVLFTILLIGLPSERLSWRVALPGAALSSLLFSVGKSLIALYISSMSTTSVYGAAGSLVVLMVWVYYSSQILLLGAELSWVLSLTPQGEFPGSPAYVAAYRERYRARREHLLEVKDDSGNVHQMAIAPARNPSSGTQ